jgi:hypothetical protein
MLVMPLLVLLLPLLVRLAGAQVQSKMRGAGHGCLNVGPQVKLRHGARALAQQLLQSRAARHHDGLKVVEAALLVLGLFEHEEEHEDVKLVEGVFLPREPPVRELGVGFVEQLTEL